jgi:SSS family solute:Na+ symporter
VILGIFLVAFYRKKTGGAAVFISAVIVEAGVIALNILSRKGIVPLSFLWFNVVGAIGVVLLSEFLQWMMVKTPIQKSTASEDQ